MSNSRRSGYNPDKVSRKMFDYRMDKFTEKLVRYANQCNEVRRDVKLIKEFLSLSPHSSAFEAFLVERGKKKA